MACGVPLGAQIAFQTAEWSAGNPASSTLHDDAIGSIIHLNEAARDQRKANSAMRQAGHATGLHDQQIVGPCPINCSFAGRRPVMQPACTTSKSLDPVLLIAL